VVDDDDDDEIDNTVNTAPPVNHPPAEPIPTRATYSPLTLQLVRPALSLCLIDDLINHIQVQQRQNLLAASSEPQPVSQPIASSSSEIFAAASLEILAAASTLTTSANHSPTSISITASTLNTESTPANSSTTVADRPPSTPPATSAEQLAKVAAFLEHKQKNGEAINEMESAGILAFIREVQGMTRLFCRSSF
jgi:hypothetical protein